MDSYFLDGVYRYLRTHSEISITMTSGVAVAVAVIAGFAVREVMRSAAPSEAAGRALLRRFNVALVPLLLVAAVTIFERFRLLS